jgi:hypothetical protein
MPASDERAIKLAARLYECRDAARTLFGADYQKRMAGHRDLVRAAMAHHGCDALKAATTLIKVSGLDGISAVIMLAAAVDISEGA